MSLPGYRDSRLAGAAEAAPQVPPPPPVPETRAAARVRGALRAGRPARPRKGQHGRAMFTPPSSLLPPQPARPSLPSAAQPLPTCMPGRPDCTGEWAMAVSTATSWDGTAGPRRFARATRPKGRAQPSRGGAAGQARVRLRRGRPGPESTPAPTGPEPDGGSAASGGQHLHAQRREGLREARGLPASCCCRRYYCRRRRRRCN